MTKLAKWVVAPLLAIALVTSWDAKESKAQFFSVQVGGFGPGFGYGYGPGFGPGVGFRPAVPVYRSRGYAPVVRPYGVYRPPIYRAPVRSFRPAYPVYKYPVRPRPFGPAIRYRF